MAGMTHDTSSVELMEDLEFSPSQLANFRTAFEVFDVNKDGRISTEEIFSVLQTMGNEISPERRRKIHEAVQAVDMEGNGELDFRAFIQFMRIMDEINKLEAQARADDASRAVDDGYSEDRATFRYFSCVLITISYAKPNALARFFVYLFFLYNLAYLLGVSVLVVFELNYLGLNPHAEDDGDDLNRFNDIVYYIRLANLLNLVHVIFLEVNSVFDALQFNGYSRTFANYSRYVLRPTFVLNLVANVLLIVGRSDASFEVVDFAKASWKETAIPAAQVLTAYGCMSFFFYFSTYVEPSTPWEKFKVFVFDVLLFNWLRIPTHVFKNVVVFLLMPFNIIFFILNCFAQCCCKDLFETKDVHSKTSKFLRVVAYHSG